MKNIKWKDGSRYNATATQAFNFFERMREEGGGDIDWKKAERSASLKGCAIHNDLEWNNRKAGALYRIGQMKKMVRTLEYIPPKMSTPVRVYESIRVEVGGGNDDWEKNKKTEISHVYRRTEEILADPAARADLLAKAIHDAQTFRRRYAALSELAVLIDAIDETIEKLA